MSEGASDGSYKFVGWGCLLGDFSTLIDSTMHVIYPLTPIHQSGHTCQLAYNSFKCPGLTGSGGFGPLAATSA